MNKSALIKGLEFAESYRLTPKEIEVLCLFMVKPLTTVEVARVLDNNPSTLHKTIQRLKKRNILVLKSRDSRGVNMLMFNEKL